MAIETVMRHQCRCERCNHVWIARKQTRPMYCANCNSPYWDRPRLKPKIGQTDKGRHVDIVKA